MIEPVKPRYKSPAEVRKSFTSRTVGDEFDSVFSHPKDEEVSAAFTRSFLSRLVDLKGAPHEHLTAHFAAGDVTPEAISRFRKAGGTAAAFDDFVKKLGEQRDVATRSVRERLGLTESQAHGGVTNAAHHGYDHFEQFTVRLGTLFGNLQWIAAKLRESERTA